MNCVEVQELLPEFINCSLDIETSRLVQEHLDRGDPQCLAYLLQLQTIADVMASEIEPVTPPMRLKSDILNRVERLGKSQSKSETSSARIVRVGNLFSGFDYKSNYGRLAIAASIIGMIIGWNTSTIVGSFVTRGTSKDNQFSSIESLNKSHSAFITKGVQFVNFGQTKKPSSSTENTYRGILIFDIIAWQAHLIFNEQLVMSHDEKLQFFVEDSEGNRESVKYLDESAGSKSGGSAYLIDLPRGDLSKSLLTVSIQGPEGSKTAVGQIVVSASLSSLFQR